MPVKGSTITWQVSNSSYEGRVKPRVRARQRGLDKGFDSLRPLLSSDGRQLCLERLNSFVQLFDGLDEGPDEANIIDALDAVIPGGHEFREDTLDFLRDHAYPRLILCLARRIVAPHPADATQSGDLLRGVVRSQFGAGKLEAKPAEFR